MASITVPTFHRELVASGTDTPITLSALENGLFSPAVDQNLASSENDMPMLTWPIAAPAETLSVPSDPGRRSTNSSDDLTTSDAHTPVTPQKSPTAAGGEGKERTLYHIVISNELGFEKTVYRRWSQVSQFDEQWSGLYPALHKQFRLVAPSSSIFHSKLKKQTLRLQALQTYFSALLPVMCLRTFLAHFLGVHVSTFAPERAMPGASPITRLGEDLALLALLSPQKLEDGSVEERPKGNTDKANKKAQKTFAKFAKENRAAFEKLLPAKVVATLQPRVPLSIEPITMQHFSSASERSSPRANKPTVSQSGQHPAARAKTEPSTRQTSRRTSTTMNGNNSSLVQTSIIPPFVAPTTVWLHNSSIDWQTGGYRASVTQPVPVDMNDESAIKVDTESSVDFSKLKGQHEKAEDDKIDEEIDPALASGTTTPGTLSRGKSSRSTLRASEPLALTLRSGASLSGFTLTTKGWWFCRDASGNECYYRSGSMGGLASLARAANLGREDEEPIASNNTDTTSRGGSTRGSVASLSASSLSTSNRGSLASLSVPPSPAPALPRRGTIYRNKVAASLPGSRVGSRQQSPDGRAATGPSSPRAASVVKNSSPRSAHLANKRASQPMAALMHRAGLKQFLEERRSSKFQRDSVREESAADLVSPTSAAGKKKSPGSKSRRSNKRHSTIRPELLNGSVGGGTRPSSRRASVAHSSHSGSRKNRANSPSPVGRDSAGTSSSRRGSESTVGVSGGSKNGSRVASPAILGGGRRSRANSILESIPIAAAPLDQDDDESLASIPILSRGASGQSSHSVSRTASRATSPSSTNRSHQRTSSEFLAAVRRQLAKEAESAAAGRTEASSEVRRQSLGSKSNSSNTSPLSATRVLSPDSTRRAVSVALARQKSKQQNIFGTSLTDRKRSSTQSATSSPVTSRPSSPKRIKAGTHRVQTGLGTSSARRFSTPTALQGGSLVAAEDKRLREIRRQVSQGSTPRSSVPIASLGKLSVSTPSSRRQSVTIAGDSGLPPLVATIAVGSEVLSPSELHTPKFHDIPEGDSISPATPLPLVDFEHE